MFRKTPDAGYESQPNRGIPIDIASCRVIRAGIIMKASLPRVLAVVLLGFIAAGTPTPLLRAGTPAANTVDDLRKAIVAFPYTWDHDKIHHDIKFNADGTGKSAKSPFKWQAVNAQRVNITWLKGSGEPNGYTGDFTFSQDYSTYTGTDRAAKTFEVNGHRVGGGSAALAANESAIDTIADTGPATTASVLVPLDAKHPPGVRAGIIALREKLLDEAAKAPASSPETYKAAVALCDSWIAALDERDNTAASQASKQPMGTADMDSSKAVHPGYYELQKEGMEAKKKKQDDAKENAFFSDAQKQEWLQRCTVWQKQLDQLYAQMGDLRRKADQARNSTAPAAAATQAGAPPPP